MTRGKKRSHRSEQAETEPPAPPAVALKRKSEMATPQSAQFRDDVGASAEKRLKKVHTPSMAPAANVSKAIAGMVAELGTPGSSTSTEPKKKVKTPLTEETALTLTRALLGVTRSPIVDLDAPRPGDPEEGGSVPIVHDSVARKTPDASALDRMSQSSESKKQLPGSGGPPAVPRCNIECGPRLDRPSGEAARSLEIEELIYSGDEGIVAPAEDTVLDPTLTELPTGILRVQRRGVVEEGEIEEEPGDGDYSESSGSYSGESDEERSVESSGSSGNRASKGQRFCRNEATLDRDGEWVVPTISTRPRPPPPPPNPHKAVLDVVAALAQQVERAQTVHEDAAKNISDCMTFMKVEIAMMRSSNKLLLAQVESQKKTIVELHTAINKQTSMLAAVQGFISKMQQNTQAATQPMVMMPPFQAKPAVFSRLGAPVPSQASTGGNPSRPGVSKL